MKMESVAKLVQLVLIVGFLPFFTLESINVSAKGPCDISILSGNATVLSGMIRSYVSEKELEKYVLCSLDAVSQQKVTCDLSPANYLELDQTVLSDNDMGLNFTLIHSVDEQADKPFSMTSISCSFLCVTSESSLSEIVTRFSAKISLVNDHAPVITQNSFEINDFPESFPHGNHAFDINVLYNLNITATDMDTAADSSSKVTFNITEGNEDGTFSIETTSLNPNAANEIFIAQIYLEKQLNYEAHPNYTLTIQAQDQGSPQLSNTMTLTINIQHNNDTLGPAFDRSFYRATINESDVFDGGKHVIDMEPESIHARDQDTGSDVGIMYSIIVDDCGSSCDAISNAFSVDENTAQITFDSSAHYEDINSYVAVFGVKAIGHGAYKRSALAIVSIYLSPPPVTTTPIPTTTEATTTTVVPITTTTTDVTTDTPTTCSPCTPCPTVSTELPTTGDTTVYTSTTVTSFTTSHTGTSELTTDEPTTHAHTTDSPMPTTTPCDCPTTTVFTTVCPTTESEGTSNTDWTASTSGESTTSVDPGSTTESEGTGTTKWTTSTSYDSSSTGSSTVTTVTNTPIVTTEPSSDTTTQCTSSSTDASTTTTMHPEPPPNPYFLETLHLSGSTVVGTVVVQVTYNSDPTETYSYSLTGCNEDSRDTQYFSIDQNLGMVTVIKSLTVRNYCLNVTVESNSTDLIDSGTIVFDVTDGSTEDIFPQKYYEVHILEDVETMTLLIDLNSTYESQHGLDVVYKIVTDVEAGLFFINASTGELFTMKGLDHEAHPFYQLIISVSIISTHERFSNELIKGIADFQYGNLSQSETFIRVFVDDVNDNYPVFDVDSTYSIGITSYLGQGQTVMTVTATDADTTKEFNQIYYSISDILVPFFVNSDSGLLRATKSLEILQKSNPKNYEFILTAANSKDGLTMPSNLQLTVYILESDEIIVMNTPESVVDFDELSVQIISTFKAKLNVDARIIQWGINEDGSNVVYLYMFPLASIGFQRVKRGTTVGAPLKNDQMLKMIKANAASLEPFFTTNSAKSFSDDVTPINTNTSGLIATIVILAVLLVVIVGVGVGYGVLQYRKRRTALHVQANPVYSNGDVNKDSNVHVHATPMLSTNLSDDATNEDSKYSYVDVSKDHTYDILPTNLLNGFREGLNKTAKEEEENRPSSSSYRDHSSYSESINESVNHFTKVVPFERLTDAEEPISNEITTSEVEVLRPEPELDYLKSILVDSKTKSDDQMKVEQRRKSVVKFADDITNSDDEQQEKL